MKTVTLAVEQAILSKAVRHRFLAEIDTADGPQYMWSGAGTLTYDGHDWIGVGLLGRITGAGETAEVKVTETSYELSGITDLGALDAFLDNPIRGRIAKAWIAFFDDRERLIPDPLLIDESILDVPTTSVGEDGRAVLVLNATSAIFDFSRARALALTHEQAMADYPDGSDTGFNRIPTEVADKQISWTPS